MTDKEQKLKNRLYELEHCRLINTRSLSDKIWDSEYTYSVKFYKEDNNVICEVFCSKLIYDFLKHNFELIYNDNKLTQLLTIYYELDGGKDLQNIYILLDKKFAKKELVWNRKKALDDCINEYRKEIGYDLDYKINRL